MNNEDKIKLLEEENEILKEKLKNILHQLEAKNFMKIIKKKFNKKIKNIRKKQIIIRIFHLKRKKNMQEPHI